MKDLISVVVPIFNVEKYLDRCITSITSQTYRNLEIILVDDGSPDNCPQMCDAWAEKDSRIKVIHKKNQGLGMARNTGLEHATGKYICFFDSDDYVASETIEKAYGAAIENCSDIVVFGLQRVNMDGMVMSKSVPETPKNCFYGKDVQELFLPDLIDNSYSDVLVKNLQFSAWSCLFSMELIQRTKWRFVSERELISEDCYSLIWLYKYVRCVAVVPESLYYYRDNHNSLTRTFRQDRHRKNRHFYLQCSKMAEEQGLGKEVQKSIAALYLGFTISAVKQLVEADIGYYEKRYMLREMLNDAILQSAITKIRDRDYGQMKKMLFWVMKHKWCSACYLLFLLRRVKDKKLR